MADNHSVEAMLNQDGQWREEMARLRCILRAFDLDEAVKWGKPCYTYKGGNVAILQGFKTYCALLFVKGALLDDPEGLLVRQTEHVQAGRQVRFSSVQEIEHKARALHALIGQAIQVEKAGLEVATKETDQFPVPQELRAKWAQDAAFKTAFEALSPGRQRAYLLHFAQPKRSETRQARIEKWAAYILEGKGLHDRQ